MCEIAVMNGGVNETDGTVHLGLVEVEKSVAVAEVKQVAVLECQRLDVVAHFLLGQVLEHLVFLVIMIGVNVEMRDLHRLLDFRMQRIGNAV